MTYRTEFPDFDFEVPACVTEQWDFADVSWRNDSCPRFVCDVFELFIDYTDRSKRSDVEMFALPQFTMKDEDHVVLETDNWEDVVAFVEQGQRFFPDYKPPQAAVEAIDKIIAEETAAEKPTRDFLEELHRTRAAIAALVAEAVPA